MDQSLAYVREILAAHTENNEMGKKIFKKISEHNYSSGEQFAQGLSQEESYYLNAILKEAIDYSQQEQDYERARQLNEVYEQLFI